MKASGSHLLAEFDKCQSDLLNNAEQLTELIECSIKEAGLSLLSSHSHPYDPIGLTVVSIISESHVVVHTFPESSHVSVDVFTCARESQKAENLIACLAKALRSESKRVLFVRRGEQLEVESDSVVSLQQRNAMSLRVPSSSLLFSARGLFEHIEVFEAAEFGRMLLLDASARLSDCDYGEYAQAMCLPAKGGALRSTLLLGCGTLKLGNAFAELEPKAVTLREHDADLFSLLREYFPRQYQAILPKESELCCETLSACDSEARFDAAFVDITLTADAFGHASRREFFDSLLGQLAASLEDGASISMNCGAESDEETQTLFRELLAKHFQNLAFATVSVPYVLGKTVLASGIRHR